MTVCSDRPGSQNCERQQYRSHPGPRALDRVVDEAVGVAVVVPVRRAVVPVASCAASWSSEWSWSFRRSPQAGA